MELRTPARDHSLVAQQTNQRIDNASRDDLRDIRAAYEHARAMQRDAGSSIWPEFSDAAILDEIRTGRLYRVLMDDSIVGVFSLAHEDPAIWGAMDTWAANTALIDFYMRRGFHLVEERRLGADSRLPPHYHHNSFALLERSCGTATDS